MDVKKIVDGMSIEQLCQQVLVRSLSNKHDPSDIKSRIEKEPVGSFYCDQVEERVGLEKLQEKFDNDKSYHALAKQLTGLPCVMTTDIEYGPGSYCLDLPHMPNPMAWGACNDPDLIERAGELTGRICRKAGVNHILAPVVDLNINFQAANVGIRSVSDDPDRVIKIAGAYIRGVQKKGYLGACLKHFPGDGIDDRNQHFMTIENSLSQEEWMNSYGKVYKELFKQGVMSVMVGHISLPAFQSEREKDVYGALPGTASYDLITGLLKGKLGFEGCVISDAMSMIGICARIKPEKLGTEFFKAGGDLMLFPENGELERLISAVKSGEISIERIKDAATRVLKMKERLRLFEDTDIDAEIGDISLDLIEMEKVGQQISDTAVHVVRNFENVIPFKKPNPKVLMINLTGHYYYKPIVGDEFRAMADEFCKQGATVKELFDPYHTEVEEIMDDYDLIVAVTKIHYHGATLRMGWKNIMSFWRGLVLHHPGMVFVSLDDPYKLYDFPYAKTYINTFGDSDCSMRSAVKLILGKIEDKGKNPVSFKNYFNIED